MTSLRPWLTAGLLSLVAQGAVAAETLQRVALVIGSNDGGDERVQLRYASTDAEAFAAVLGELGGVMDGDVVVLEDPGRIEVERAMDELAVRASAAKKSGHRVEVVLYYSGHSNIEGLLPKGELLPYGTIRARLKTLDADVKVSVLDSCASGALIRTKGGVKRPSFLVDQSNIVQGEAFLTSSTADEASQESDEIEASFFTHHLVTGLRGAADADEDGLITLREAYAYTFKNTRQSTENSIAGPQNPNYALDLVGQGELVLTDLRQASSLLVLDSKLDGELWLRATDGRLFAEVDKILGTELTLSVPAGTYTATLQTRPQQYVARIRVEPETSVTLSSDLFFPGELTASVLRGDRPLPAVTSSMPPKAETTSPAAFTVVGSVGNSSPRNGVRGFAYDLVQGTHHSVHGVEMSLIAGTTLQEVRGAQLSMGVNVAGGRLSGTQLSGLVNVAGGQDNGFQFAGLMNIAGNDGPEGGVGGQMSGIGNVDAGSRKGAQLAGIFNASGRHLTGVQMAGAWNAAGGTVSGVQLSAIGNSAGKSMVGAQLSTGINIARGMHGAQLGLINSAGGTGKGAQLGLVNVAGSLKGFQLGLVNIAQELDGDAVGLITVAKDGYHAWELWSDDISPFSSSVKFGGKHIYSMIAVGGDPRRSGGATLGFGLGGHIPFGTRGYVDLDVLLRNTEVTPDDLEGAGPTGLITSVRPQVGVQLGKAFRLFGGPAWHTTFGLRGDPGSSSFIRTWQLGPKVRMGLGFQAGLGIRF